MIETIAKGLLYYTIGNASLVLLPDVYYALNKVKSCENDCFIVTGGANGLGKAIATELCVRKCGKLVLVDLNAEALKKTAAELSSKFKNVQVYTYVVNLADEKQIYKFAEDVIKQVGKVDCIVNNAGIVMGKYLLENSDATDLLTMKVNTLSHLWMAKAFLKHFESNQKGHFINISSMAAYYGAAGMVTYAMSKFGARGFAEALSAEFRNRKSPIKVTCVCPSHMDTELFKGFNITGNWTMTPEYVAKSTLDCYESNRELICLPRYSIPILPVIGFAQAIGFLNIPSVDKDHPMQKWGSTEYANERFKLMSKV